MHMKKVLIGICGIGNGHVNRQICVIKKLLNDGMKIVVATTKEKEKMINEVFPDIVVLNINISILQLYAVHLLNKAHHYKI